MRIISISYLRVLAMLMVVALHSLNYYGNWGFKDIVVEPYLDLSSFLNDIAIPLFMCISGYLFAKTVFGKKCDFKSFVKSKFNRLIVPYLIWGIVQMLLIPERYNLKQLLFGVSHLWFLLTLFLIFLIMFILQNYWKNVTVKQNLLIILLLFLLYPLSKYSHNFLRIASVVKYLPFFIMGIMVFKNQIIKNVNLKKAILAVLFICMFLIKFLYNDALGDTLSFELCQIISLMFVYLLFDLCIDSNLPNFKGVIFLDKLSMGIYIIHHIIIIYGLQYSCIKDFLSEYWRIGPLIIFTVSFILSVVITILIKSNRFTRIILG